MRLRRSRALLAPSTLLCALLLATTASAADDRAQDNLDFGKYPANAQDCLYDAADASKCAPKDKAVPAVNECLCRGNNDFVAQTAFCVNKKDKNSMSATYDLLKSNCDASKTPLKIDKKTFLEAKDPAADDKDKTTTSKPKSSTTPTSSSTSSATSAAATTTSAAPTPTDSPQPTTGLSGGAIGGIAGGAAAGFAVLAAVGIFIFKRKRNHREQDESHQLLPGGPVFGAKRTSAMSTGAPQDWSHDPERDSAADPKWYSGQADPTKSVYSASDVSATTPHQSWGYNPNAPYAAAAVSPGLQPSPYNSPRASQLSPPLVAPALTHQPPVPQQPAVFELGGGQGVGPAQAAPAEMPASELDGGRPGGAPQAQQQPVTGWAAYRPPPPP